MKRIVPLLVMALALLAARGPDWTQVVSRTDAGSYLVGNPKARVRLVEYLSYSCSHCAHFTSEAAEPLRRDFIREGRVSYEVRNAVRDRYDFVAALAARCRGPRFFFRDTEALMAQQETLLAQAQAAEQAMPPVAGTSEDVLIANLAKASGIGALLARSGVTPARLSRCLTDSVARKQIVAMTKEAWDDRKIPGTPAFLINGELTGGGWPEIRDRLTTALVQPTKKAG